MSVRVEMTGWSDEALKEWRDATAPEQKNFWNFVEEIFDGPLGGVVFIALIVLSLLFAFFGIIPGGLSYCFAALIALFMLGSLALRFKIQKPSWIQLSPTEFSRAVGGAISHPVRLAMLDQLNKNKEACFEVEYLQPTSQKKKFPGPNDKNFILWMYPQWFDSSNRLAILVVQNGTPVSPPKTH